MSPFGTAPSFSDGSGTTTCFYINTANNASHAQIDYSITTPGLDVTAMISRLRFRMQDGLAQGGPTSFAGNFGINLKDVSGGDNKLIAEANDKAAAFIREHLKAKKNPGK